MLRAVPVSNSRPDKRVYISPDALRSRRLAAGDWVCITCGDESVIAQLWPKAGLAEDELAMSSNWQLVEMTLFDTTQSKLVKSVTFQGKSIGRDGSWLQAALKETLLNAKYFHRDYTASVNGELYKLLNVQISQKANGIVNGMSDMVLMEVFEMDWKSVVKVVEKDDGDIEQNLSYHQLGGLDQQIDLVRNLIELPLQHPDHFRSFGLTPPRGVLLFGPPGTGKTALARAVAFSTPGCSCLVVNGPELSSSFHGETEERLRGVFEKARNQSPCIIVLDEIDALCPRRDGDGGEVEKRVVATLLTLMDGMDNHNERVFVIAATNRPNSIDPALRRPGRFDKEVEIGIPDAPGRRQIIDVLVTKMPHTLSNVDLKHVAERTHGYVGADLGSLIRESASLAIQRAHSSGHEQPLLTIDDINTILPSIRPSTMREVFVETPTVRWWDIGGQEGVKQKLRECVEWPLTHRETFTRLGVEAPKGVLLYGPPGCSKTMTAKALATESGLNFLAVKGPELLNKFVGESERAVREIFRKARAAAPSIIFFDEIDALGSSRNEDSPHNGVLTSLLNEMDGVEELSGVTVVAATNRPDVLDDALMRPGRLDRILYVGPPDLETRREIFRIKLTRMATEGVNLELLAEMTDGCSGAEIASICQDAALSAMNEDLEAKVVEQRHFIQSAKTVRRRITPEMVEFFTSWRDQSGVRSA